MPAADDYLDGCEVRMDDPDQVTEDGDETLALVLFADLPWTGEVEEKDGRSYPVVDPAALAARIAELQELDGGAT